LPVARFRWLRATGALALAFVLVGGPVRAATLEQYQAQAAQVDAALSDAQRAYAAAQAAWQAAHQKLLVVQQQIADVSARIEELQGQAAAAQARAATLSEEIAATQAQIVALTQRSDAGLVLLQEHGTVSFLAVLLGANSFRDFLTRLDFLRRIWVEEMGLLRQTRAAQAALAGQQRQLAAAQAALQAALAQADAQRQRLVQARDAAAATRSQEQAAAAQAAAAISRLTAEKSGIMAAIRDLLARLRNGSVTWDQVLQIVQSLASQYGIDPKLVEAVIIAESGGNPGARSPVGAAGLMQLMPGTAAGLGVSDPFDPEQNVRGGITYLLQMLQLFHGNLELALAAYNAGPAAVEKYGGVPPFPETQNYVREVLGLYQQGK
jgi:soluble lytic murein transglycosylase-like protein